MTPNEHAELLGKLLHNFQCLETWLRFVLLKLATDQHANA